MESRKTYTESQIKFFRITLVILGILLILMSLPLYPVGFLITLFGIFCFWLSHYYKKNLPTRNSTSPAPTDSVVDESKKNYVLFDDVVGDYIIKYEYEDKLFLLENSIDVLSGHGGEDLTFTPEPENDFDENAVAVYLGASKVGYVYKGKIQEMLNDWIKRKDYLRGYINKINKTEKFVTYKIAFYKEKDTFESKTFSLVKTGKKIDEDTKRSDKLELLSEGDAVSIDYEDNCFVVCDDCGYEIGELPTSAENFVKENAKCVGILESMDFDEHDKPKAKVTVYLL